MLPRLLCLTLLCCVGFQSFAGDPFFEEVERLRNAEKEKRQTYLYPRGERFTQDNQSKDTIVALRWFATAGDPEAQAAMGDLFAKGLYEKHSLEDAIYWYSIAAQNGSLYGKYMMGIANQLGWTGKVDLTTADLMFREVNMNDAHARAARQVAQFFVDRDSAMYNIEEAFRWYETAAEAGDVDAQLTLADWFNTGQHVSQNTLMAVKWYGRAAAQKDPYAQYSLGAIYLHGDKTIPTDYSQAVYWTEMAARNGFAAAQYTLGRLYYQGEGVPRNNVLAYAWWSLANNQSPSPRVTDAIAQVSKKMSMGEIEQAVKLADLFRVEQ